MHRADFESLGDCVRLALGLGPVQLCALLHEEDAGAGFLYTG